MRGEGSGSAQGTEKEKEGEENREEEAEKVLIGRRWTSEEDAKLLHLVDLHGESWAVISSQMPGRCSSSCQTRRYRLLSPAGKWRRYTAEEDDIIIRAQQEHGNNWTEIAEFLPGRSRTSIECRWRTNLQHLSSVVASASSSSNVQIDFPERKRLCQREEEDVETPDAATVNLLEPDPITLLSLSLPGSGGDGGGSVKGKEKKE